MAEVYVNELLLLIFPEDGWWVSKSAFCVAPKLFAKDGAADVSHKVLLSGWKNWTIIRS